MKYQVLFHKEKYSRLSSAAAVIGALKVRITFLVVPFCKSGRNVCRCTRLH